MLTEKDEFIYHEMIVHPALAVFPETERVLVIGAGDGGVLRELTRYANVRSVDVAEIDGRVAEVCRRFLPQTACGFDDPRVSLHIQDGLKFVRRKENQYDLIIVDSTDPFGPGEALFTREVYQAHIPTYPSGHWLFGFASKKFHPLVDLKADAWNALNLKTRYYNTDLHRGAFALPNYVKELLSRE